MQTPPLPSPAVATIPTGPHTRSPGSGTTPQPGQTTKPPHNGLGHQVDVPLDGGTDELDHFVVRYRGDRFDSPGVPGHGQAAEDEVLCPFIVVRRLRAHYFGRRPSLGAIAPTALSPDDLGPSADQAGHPA